MNKTNGDEPINPTTAAMLPEFEGKQLNGLTKREYFAAMAMQGMLAAGKLLTSSSIKEAIAYADALIDGLNGEYKETKSPPRIT